MKQTNRKIAFIMAIAIVILVLLTSCGGGEDVSGNIPEKGKFFTPVYSGVMTQVKSFEYDGCTYLVYKTASTGGMTHHAGCGNSKHEER